MVGGTRPATLQKTATVPADVVAALEANGRAKAAFDSLAKSDQYLLYLPILQARSTKSRAARIEKLIASLQAGRQDPRGRRRDADPGRPRRCPSPARGVTRDVGRPDLKAGLPVA